MAIFSPRVVLVFGSLILGVGLASGACSATNTHNGFTQGAGGSVGNGAATTTGTGNSTASAQGGGGSTGALTGLGGLTGSGGGMLIGDPVTCAEAAANATYIGCDFWPTVVANNVWSIFDFAAVVANAGTATATVTVTGNGMATQTVSVAANSLAKIYLPWVPALKGQDFDQCTALVALGSSVVQTGGAYHLVSSVPVTVYQFSALEYSPQGGPSGKNWSSCPGTVGDCEGSGPVGCFSYSNDASLLLPSTAMTGNYRITSQADWSDIPEGAYFAITGTQDGTSVTVYVAPGGHVVAGSGGISDTPGGGQLTFSLNAGDVAELVGDGMGDLAGSLVAATHPVQVISGMPCAYQPFNTGDPACDHLEQSVFPAETLGKHYFVNQPTAPHSQTTAQTHGHIVRLIGNAAGTTLTYPGGKAPAGAPLTLSAGQVVDMGIVNTDFEVVGNHEFAVATFMLGASIIDPQDMGSATSLGDPSQSNAVAVEQYRTKYVFLAPSDYTESYVDITEPTGTTVTLDGSPVSQTVKTISSSYGIARVPLGAGNNGAHVLTATAPVGIQVIGYGSYTSYQYPGGLNLVAIAPPPPPPK